MTSMSFSFYNPTVKSGVARELRQERLHVSKGFVSVHFKSGTKNFTAGTTPNQSLKPPSCLRPWFAEPTT